MCAVTGAIFCLLGATSPATEPVASPTVRCAVVGGLNEIELWCELADRFRRHGGGRLEITATGARHGVIAAFRAGDADAILMHSSDAMINLVADGLGIDPQPWARNDFVIVGPASDPAGIRGERDAVSALRKIVSARAKVLLHASSGVAELTGDLLAAGELEFHPESTIYLPGERHRQMLQRAAAEQAYTIVGRIPFLNGKLERGDLVVMVQGDERLRRPYLVVTTANQSSPAYEAARAFARFLRSSETQSFIAKYGSGRYDDQPLLFPIKTGP